MVLAVHSSYLKNDPGRYKTAGQVAPLSTVGDKVFVYLADTTGKYTLYIYTIKRSEEIPEIAVDILKQDVTEKLLTLFTCYPIGTSDARRVNQAVLTETLSEEEFQSAVISDQSVVDSHQSATVSKFKTQAVKANNATKVKTNISTKDKANTTNKITKSSKIIKSPKLTKSSKIKPTFKERVLFRPAVYNTAMKLVKSV